MNRQAGQLGSASAQPIAMGRGRAWATALAALAGTGLCAAENSAVHPDPAGYQFYSVKGCELWANEALG